jgi:hypothetical protein
VQRARRQLPGPFLCALLWAGAPSGCGSRKRRSNRNIGPKRLKEALYAFYFTFGARRTHPHHHFDCDFQPSMTVASAPKLVGSGIGQRFLLDAPVGEDAGSPITLVLNGAAGLKQ